jgi:hypothetical protein
MLLNLPSPGERGEGGGCLISGSGASVAPDNTGTVTNVSLVELVVMLSRSLWNILLSETPNLST